VKKFAILALAALAACDDTTLPAPAAHSADVAGLAVRSREGYLPLPDGAQMYYQVDGTGPDTVVVVSGGPGLSYRYMRDDLLPLSHGRTVIWYDARGAGRSTLIADPTQAGMPRQMADLDALRQFFGIDRMKLIGHSSGAMLAVNYAAQYGHVDRLLLLNPGPVATLPYAVQFDSARGSRFTQEQVDLQNTLAYQLMTRSTTTPVQACEQFFATLFSVYFHDGANQAAMRGRFCDVSEEAAFATLPTLLAGMAQWGVWDYTQSLLPGIGVPALVVHGTADPVPQASSEAYAASLPAGEIVVLQNAGHFPWLETPEAFYEAINPFLNRAFPHAD
jgi:proline iminopeptidase